MGPGRPPCRRRSPAARVGQLWRTAPSCSSLFMFQEVETEACNTRRLEETLFPAPSSLASPRPSSPPLPHSCFISNTRSYSSKFEATAQNSKHCLSSHFLRSRRRWIWNIPRIWLWKFLAKDGWDVPGLFSPATDHPGARPSPSAFPSPGQLASSMQTGLGIAVTFFSQRFGGMGRGWGACLLRCAT